MDKIKIKNNIPEILKQKQMSVYRLSKISGLTRETLYNICEKPYLGGHQIKTLVIIAHALDLKIDDLFEIEISDK